MKLIVPLLKRYKSVTVPVLTRYTSVTATSNMISANKKTSGQDPFVIPNLSVSELGKYISRLGKKKKKKKKSSGLDGISNQLLKLSLQYIIDSLIYVFNLCMIFFFFLFFSPSELKKAKVVPLPKSTDKTNPTNYIPVSLLYCLFCQSFSKSMYTFI